MSREHPAFPPVSGGPSTTWETTHDAAHYGPLAPHLEGLNQYPGPIGHHADTGGSSSSHHHHHHPGSLHLSTGSIDHQAIGDAFLRQEFLASSLSPTNTSTVPTSPLATGTSTTGFFGMLDTQSNAGDEIISAAIEEDKRRRNTAASARFRMKKKEREAVLERRTREMTDRCEELQKRISALETENRWLRELITERSRNRGRVRRSSPSGKGEKALGKAGGSGGGGAAAAAAASASAAGADKAVVSGKDKQPYALRTK